MRYLRVPARSLARLWLEAAAVVRCMHATVSIGACCVSWYRGVNNGGGGVGACAAAALCTVHSGASRSRLFDSLPSPV